MKLINLITNEINQNGYHFNKLTKNKIGILYIAPVNFVPDDCLSCDGYVLKIIDYKKLHSVIGTTFNTGEESKDEFRIPDYNITGRFLQPGTKVGSQIAAGLPIISEVHFSTTLVAEEVISAAFILMHPVQVPYMVNLQRFSHHHKLYIFVSSINNYENFIFKNKFFKSK